MSDLQKAEGADHMPGKSKIVLELTPKEADALWTAANNGRNDFRRDPDIAKLYFGSPRGIGNADRAIDKLAKASRGKIALQPYPANRYDWMESSLRKRFQGCASPRRSSKDPS